ncbi:MAG TPA: response regulator [Candidatus Wunengus sp. YC60]|uniref:response regulator n=1 Tax=Candidatus Wunengus sp. YC60 TaxID=3367697 RepID=UPI004025EF47
MKKKILLVDDEETLRWALHEALSEEGFDIENTNDSVEALAFTRKTKYDLVISDLKMPIMGGLQLISEIKKQNPDTKAIIITAYGSIEAVIEAMHLGVMDFITKPFKIEHIKSVIYRVLNDSSILNHNNISCTKSTENERLKKEYNNLCSQTDAFFVTRDTTGTACNTFYDVIGIGKLNAFVFGSISREVDIKNLDVIVKTIFRYLLKTDKSPASLLKEINQYLCKNILKRFPVTLFCAVLDGQRQTLHYSIYGEELTCFISLPGKEIKMLESSPFPLNMFPGMAVMESNASFVLGSKLVLIHNSSLLKGLKSGTITADRFKDAISDGSATSSEDMAKGIKLQVEGLDESIAEEKDCAVMVSGSEFQTQISASWEEVMSIPIPISNYVEILEQFDKKLLPLVGDDYKRQEVVTSVNEAVLNAVSFAYHEDKKGSVFLKFSMLGDEVIIEVSDHGCGFDVQAYTEPDITLYKDLTKKSGRGVFIMKQLMDRVMIQSSKEMGTTVHMAKRVGCDEN